MGIGRLVLVFTFLVGACLLVYAYVLVCLC